MVCSSEPSTRGRGQEDQEFKVISGYPVRLRRDRNTEPEKQKIGEERERAQRLTSPIFSSKPTQVLLNVK